MKRITVLILFLFTTLLLSSCGEQNSTLLDLDYTDFEDHALDTFLEAETKENERYIVYYYMDSCGHCKEVKQEVLNFFYEFTLMPYYLLDISHASDETSFTKEEFPGTPTLYIMADGEIVESYSGPTNIRSFIEMYSDIDSLELDYDFFSTQHITTYEEALNIDSDAYILYFYQKSCPHCQKAKPEFLRWALQRDIRDIYFMDKMQLSSVGTPPTELLILNSGTPILVVMSNGEFADEYYSGTDPVLEYINQIGLGEIPINN